MIANPLTDLYHGMRRYFDKVGKKSNKNYVRGRNFEYRVMKYLRDRGWHCMRRFGSHDENVKGIGKVSTDLTAFKNGIYLIITCKYSINHATTWRIDPKVPNLIKYCQRFSSRCIPVFAGVNNKHRM